MMNELQNSVAFNFGVASYYAGMRAEQMIREICETLSPWDASEDKGCTLELHSSDLTEEQFDAYCEKVRKWADKPTLIPLQGRMV